MSRSPPLLGLRDRFVTDGPCRPRAERWRSHGRCPRRPFSRPPRWRGRTGRTTRGRGRPAPAASHLELGAQGAQGQQRPVQRIHRHPQQAAPLVDRLDLRPTADPIAHRRRRGVHQHLHLDRRTHPAHPGADELGGVGGGQLPGAEPGPGATRLGEPVQPEAAPVVPVQVVGHQVPAPAERDQPVRLDVPAGRLGVPGGVAEAQPLGVPAGLRDGDQHLVVDRRPRARPGSTPRAR